MKTLDIIVPCYNEAEGLEIFLTETRKVTNTMQGYTTRFILVNDGSKDDTLKIMHELADKYPLVSYLSFSRNFGKEAAMYAGLQASTGDYVIVMDADLQHPPALIPRMAASIEAGHDCCAAMRSNRKGEAPIRSFLSRSFYHVSNRLTDVHLEYGAVDFRMMSRQMVDAILELCEVERFSKGIFAWVGFDTEWIPYENVERAIGTTKWNLRGLAKYAILGITSFSVAPLKLLTLLGLLISGGSLIYIIATLIQTLIYGIDVPGYVTTLCAVLFLGGVIEFSIGILGEYMAHIYLEAKDRPVYILKEKVMNTSVPIGTDLTSGVIPTTFPVNEGAPDEPEE